ncbi:hypothetical protein VPH35_135876 [Triticum aestivum]
MAKRTMGGRADAGADAMVSPTPEQVAPPPEQVTPLPRHLPPLPRHLLPLPRHLHPLPQPVVNVDGDDDEEEVAALAPQTEQVTPPVPEPVVVGDVNKEDVTPQPQPGLRLPRLLPPLPPPVVVADENEEEVFSGQYKANKVLSDDVDSDPETQGIYTRQKVRELDSGVLEKRVMPRIGRGATDALTATS